MLGLAGFLLVGLHIVLAWLSPNFASEIESTVDLIPLIVAVELLAGGVYLLAVHGVIGTSGTKRSLIWVLVVGAALRVCAMMSTPILEDDYYRYFWDGAVTANGFNPYLHAPDKIVAELEGASKGFSAVPLVELARDSGRVIERINHGRLRTVYPPVAQISFALAYWLHPWSLTAWRFVLLGFDLLTLGLVAASLTWLNRPLHWIIVYWWNPIIVNEIINSAHMDAIVLPFILGAILLAVEGRHLLATGAIGMAIGAKLWPVILLPVLLRPLLSRPRKLLLPACLLGFLALIYSYPVFQAGWSNNLGFEAYSRSWEMNDALFMFILWGFQALPGQFWLDVGQPVTRIVVLGLLAGCIAWIVRNDSGSDSSVFEKCLWVTAALFLLSPTEYPWYYVWLVPLLAIRPRLSLLMFSALLPLYYLRFYFDIQGRVGVFDNGIVWLEYLPVWCLLVWEWGRGAGRAKPGGVLVS